MRRPGTATVVCLALLLGSCSRLGYYAHLGKGGFALVTQGENVERLLGDGDTPAALKVRLLLARDLLEFAEGELGLPVGKKYRRYLDLERPYVSWTVVAAPEFSLVPKTWCFPIAGCVGYRGFFSREKADRYAGRLRVEGYDVSVGGVRAFSSLGWFGEPLLNTFLYDEDHQLAGLLFHELAHSVVYVGDDTAFNESFASSVERFGVELWLDSGAGDERAALVGEYRHSLEELEAADAMVRGFRTRLEDLYAQLDPGASEDELRRRKAELFAALQEELLALAAAGNQAYSGWIGRDLGNADLASVGFYREHVEAFSDLREALENDLDAFYSSTRCLAALDPAERLRRLEERSWRECILGRS